MLIYFIDQKDQLALLTTYRGGNMQRTTLLEKGSKGNPFFILRAERVRNGSIQMSPHLLGESLYDFGPKLLLKSYGPMMNGTVITPDCCFLKLKKNGAVCWDASREEILKLAYKAEETNPFRGRWGCQFNAMFVLGICEDKRIRPPKNGGLTAIVKFFSIEVHDTEK